MTNTQTEGQMDIWTDFICEKVKDLICKAKAKYYQDKVEQCEGDQKITIL